MPNYLELLESAQSGQLISSSDFLSLCEDVLDLIIEEPTLLRVSSPVAVVGDIHGQVYDLLHLFSLSPPPPHQAYIFLGDFVDRGAHSIECLTLLLLFKQLYPDRITLIRGNHESASITQTYGFYDECQRKYASSSGGQRCWRAACEVFNHLPLGCLIDGELLCVHGGLSPDVHLLDDLQALSRRGEIPLSGPLCDIIWSDPDEAVDDWSLSPRGAGWVFGQRITEEFLHLNNLKMIIRAHQLAQKGYQFLFDTQLATVWSAPNYCYRCGNRASVLRIKDANKELTDDDFCCFDAVEKQMGNQPETVVSSQYFV